MPAPITATEQLYRQRRWPDLTSAQIDKLHELGKDSSIVGSMLAACRYGHMTPIDALFEGVVALTQQNAHMMKAIMNYSWLTAPTIIVNQERLPEALKQ